MIVETPPTPPSYDTYDDTATNIYGTGTTYALGAVTQITNKSYKNGSDDDFKDAGTWNTYVWYDGAVQSRLRYRSNASDSGTETNSYYTNNAAGQLTSVSVQDGRPRTISFTLDTAGQVVRRQEADNKYTIGDPASVFYRYGGREVSTTSNVYDRTGSTYSASISDRTEHYRGATRSSPLTTPKNGPKVYWNGWGGNGSVRTFNISNAFKLGGNVLTGVSIVKDARDLYVGDIKAGEFTLNTAVTVAGFAAGGVVGIGIGAGWLAFKYLAPDAHRATVDWANDNFDAASSAVSRVFQ